jgi:molybdenum cofactor cytidylyltransferase
MNALPGIVILAAGASRRLGQAKQLLALDGQSLIRRVAEAALLFRAQLPDPVPVVLVLGANADRIEPELAGLPLTVVQNPDWETGMASSLNTGLAALLRQTADLDALLVLLTDQPHVSTDLLTQLWQAFRESGKGLAACAYADRLGVPAIFAKRYFAAIQQLTGDRGASPLLNAHRPDCAVVPFAEGIIDIDTPDDLARLRGQHHHIPPKPA